MRIALTLSALAALAVLLAGCATFDAPAPPKAVTRLTGTVVAVDDGDTLTLADASGVRHRIRLVAIDAPEPTQPFGPQARASLTELARGRSASADCRRADENRTKRCKLLVEGLDVGLEQVRRGLAWHARRDAPEQSAVDQARYQGDETSARLARRGLWSDVRAVPPWLWK